MADAFLATLKLVSILLAGALGVMGLRVNYKDRQGHVTKWGKRALIGIIVSSLIAAMIQGAEVYKQRREAKQAEERRAEENKRQTQMLTEITRAVYPIFEHKELSIEFGGPFPLTDEGMIGYRDRIERTVKDMVSKHQYSAENGNIRIIRSQVINLDSSRPDTNKESGPLYVLITPASSLFPRRSEASALRAFAGYSIEVEVYRKPINPDKYLSRQAPEPDLKFHGVASKDLILNYKLGTPEIRVESGKVIVTEDTIKNPLHLSLPDLSGAQLFIHYWDSDSLYAPGTDSDQVVESYLRAESQSAISLFKLHASGHDLYIGRLKRLPNSTDPIYVYTLPDNILESDVNLPDEQ